MQIHLRIPLLVFALCGCGQARLTSRPDPHSADAAVYLAVLDSMSIWRGGKRATQIVVTDRTLTVQPQDLEMEKLPEVDKAAISDFQERNNESRSVRYLSSANLSFPVVLVSSDTLDSFLHNGPEPYWKEFYRRYPGSNGSISFSSIGYSTDGNLAVLVVDTGCGSLCGAVSNVVVKRTLGRWRVTLIQIKIMS